MTSPTSTVTALARRFAVEIDVNPSGVADWQPLIGVEEFKPVFTPRREGDEGYEDLGADRSAVLGSAWAAEIKLIHRAGADGVTMNSTQEHLRTKSLAADGITGEAHVRWYDRSGVGEAWDGRCLVDWVPDGGKGRDTVAVKLMGQGARVAITNPNASALPVVSALSPTTGLAAGGTPVIIKGRKLTGATVVTFGGTNATSFIVVDDTRIVAISPAKAAATYDVLVTTPGGVSANTTADNYIYT